MGMAVEIVGSRMDQVGPLGGPPAVSLLRPCAG